MIHRKNIDVILRAGRGGVVACSTSNWLKSYESLFGKKDSSFSPGGPQKTFLQRNALQISYYRLFLSCHADPELHKEIWPVHYYIYGNMARVLLYIWKHGLCIFIMARAFSIYVKIWPVHFFMARAFLFIWKYGPFLVFSLMWPVLLFALIVLLFSHYLLPLERRRPWILGHTSVWLAQKLLSFTITFMFNKDRAVHGPAWGRRSCTTTTTLPPTALPPTAHDNPAMQPRWQPRLKTVTMKIGPNNARDVVWVISMYSFFFFSFFFFHWHF